ncbi:MAG: multidrug effflux MFS transporter [Pseudomonadales bacterium]
MTTKPALGNSEFICLFAMITSLTALSIDTMLPALPAIAQGFALGDIKDTQLVISALVLGMVGGELIFGPLSDACGRKFAILSGMLVFIVGCLISMFATSYEWMLFGRVIQGLGVSGPKIASRALVRDQYVGAAMARIMSFIMMFFILVPMLAPALGALILSLGDWHAIFLAFICMTLICGVWLAVRQPETLTKERRIPFNLSLLMQNSKRILRHRRVMSYATTAGILFGALLLFIGMSQAIFADIYAIVDDFPLYFAILASGVGLSSFINGKLVMRFGMYKLSVIAFCAMTLFSTALLAVSAAHAGHPPLLWFMGLSFLSFCCVGMLFGNLNAMAMESLGKTAGLGASIIGSASSLVSVFFSVSLGRFYNETSYPLVIGFIIAGVMGLTLVIKAQRLPSEL